MNIYQKLQEARINIKNQELKKKGWNDYSKYAYYTPVQINEAVFIACREVKMLTKFDLLRNEFGLYGKLTLICLDDGSELSFELATNVPQIKATNTTQQMGGANTYTLRYINMNVFDISSDDLDPDNNVEDDNSSGKQLIYIQNLLDSSAIMPEDEENIRSQMERYTAEQAQRCIEYLKENQIPGVELPNPSKTDIKNHIKKITE